MQQDVLGGYSDTLGQIWYSVNRKEVAERIRRKVASLPAKSGKEQARANAENLMLIIQETIDVGLEELNPHIQPEAVAIIASNILYAHANLLIGTPIAENFLNTLPDPEKSQRLESYIEQIADNGDNTSRESMFDRIAEGFISFLNEPALDGQQESSRRALALEAPLYLYLTPGDSREVFTAPLELNGLKKYKSSKVGSIFDEVTTRLKPYITNANNQEKSRRRKLLMGIGATVSIACEAIVDTENVHHRSAIRLLTELDNYYQRETQGQVSIGEIITSTLSSSPSYVISYLRKLGDAINELEEHQDFLAGIQNTIYEIEKTMCLALDSDCIPWLYDVLETFTNGSEIENAVELLPRLSDDEIQTLRLIATDPKSESSSNYYLKDRAKTLAQSPYYTMSLDSDGRKGLVCINVENLNPHPVPNNIIPIEDSFQIVLVFNINEMGEVETYLQTFEEIEQLSDDVVAKMRQVMYVALKHRIKLELAQSRPAPILNQPREPGVIDQKQVNREMLTKPNIPGRWNRKSPNAPLDHEEETVESAILEVSTFFDVHGINYFIEKPAGTQQATMWQVNPDTKVKEMITIDSFKKRRRDGLYQMRYGDMRILFRRNDEGYEFLGAVKRRDINKFIRNMKF